MAISQLGRQNIIISCNNPYISMTGEICLTCRSRKHCDGDKVKGHMKVTPWPCTTIPNQYPCHVSTAYTLQFLRYSQDKILKVKVTTANSRVKSRSHHDVVHLYRQPMFQLSMNSLHLTVSEI